MDDLKFACENRDEMISDAFSNAKTPEEAQEIIDYLRKQSEESMYYAERCFDKVILNTN